MTITIQLSDPERRTVLHQCCSQLVWGGRKDDAELLWNTAATARDDQEVLALVTALRDVRIEVQP